MCSRHECKLASHIFQYFFILESETLRSLPLPRWKLYKRGLLPYALASATQRAIPSLVLRSRSILHSLPWIQCIAQTKCIFQTTPPSSRRCLLWCLCASALSFLPRARAPNTECSPPTARLLAAFLRALCNCSLLRLAVPLAHPVRARGNLFCYPATGCFCFLCCNCACHSLCFLKAHHNSGVARTQGLT